MREYLLTLCVAAAVTYLLTGPVRKFAIAAGAMPEIRARDVHREPTPRLGGIALFGGLCAGLLVASHLMNLGDVFKLSNEPRALLSGAGLIWLLGVLDDKWGVDALIKLGGQMIAAGVMVWQGLTILWLPVPGVGPVALSPDAVHPADGRAGGHHHQRGELRGRPRRPGGRHGLHRRASRSSCTPTGSGTATASSRRAPATLFSAILIGMCVGFLPHNIHPARIFMGDSGSMLIGLVMAASAISITGQVDPDVDHQHHRLGPQHRPRDGARSTSRCCCR